MDEAYKKKIIEEAQKNVEQRRQYLDKIPILKSINSMQNVKQIEFVDPSNHLTKCLTNLLGDEAGYRYNFKDVFLWQDKDKDKYKKGFFAFYDCVKTWLSFKCKNNEEYESKLPELRLDSPYRLAVELFVKYVNFRANAKNGAQYQAGYNDGKGEYQANIRDLFTDEDLIKLGGNEFIKDCLNLVAVTEEEIKKQYIQDRLQIKNINSRNGKTLEKNKISKPDLFERVDNHLSWKIFKDGNIKKLTQEEKLILQYTMKNEGFWKHLGKSELRILPFTGGVALILGLIAALGLGITGGTLAALILTPIGAGALVIAPIMAPISKKSAIVDNMIKTSDENKKFNNDLKQGKENYQQYKNKHPDFLKLESKKEENIKEGDNIINTNCNTKNKIIPKNGKKNEKIDPLDIVNATKQNQNERDNKNKNQENEQPGS